MPYLVGGIVVAVTLTVGFPALSLMSGEKVVNASGPDALRTVESKLAS